MSVSEPVPDGGGIAGAGADARSSRIDRERGCPGVAVGNLQILDRRCRDVIRIKPLSDAEMIGYDQRRLMVPNDIGTAIAVRSDRETRGVIIADQRKAAGARP